VGTKSLDNQTKDRKVGGTHERRADDGGDDLHEERVE